VVLQVIGAQLNKCELTSDSTRKPVVPKRTNFAESCRIQDIETLGKSGSPRLRQSRFADINSRPILLGLLLATATLLKV
jgi:hypothetical protein